jgi:S1-C subfamily serine protease
MAALAVVVGIGIGYGVWSGGTSPSANSSFGPRTGTTGGTRTGGTQTTTTTTSSNRTSSATGAPSDIAGIAKKVDPGLVDINTVLGYQTEEAAGTGMVLTSTGKVLTNNHVIEGSTSISVTDLGNGHTYTAAVLGYDRTVDVALIQLKDASGLQTVSLGSSSSVKVGESVVGIGNAGGVGGTPSKAGGSVTALDQAITASDQGSFGTTTEHLTGLIESNCDIQPGDSGGPLVNTSDQVVGMDTAASEAQGYSISGAAGQGYSIPIDAALSVVREIEAGKSATDVHIGGTGFLGVYIEANSSAATRGGLGIGSRTPTATPGTTSPTSSTSAGSGARVYSVISGTPAQSAGLQSGDIILSIGGSAVKSVNDVTKIMLQYHPGQRVDVKWTTPSGATQSATITLIGGPAD